MRYVPAAIRFLLITAVVALLPVAVQAHVLLHEIIGGEVVVVRFNFAGTDEQPWFEPYELFAPGASTPHQRGLVNADGEVAFRPNVPGSWQLRVATEDGHGASIAVEVSDTGRIEAGGPTPFGQRLVLSLAILFGLFGVAVMARQWRRCPSMADRG